MQSHFLIISVNTPTFLFHSVQLSYENILKCQKKYKGNMNDNKNNIYTLVQYIGWSFDRTVQINLTNYISHCGLSKLNKTVLTNYLENKIQTTI